MLLNSPPTLTSAGHQRTVSTSSGCNQWLSLAKPLLKVALAGRNRSLVTQTSKCGWAISVDVGHSPKDPDLQTDGPRDSSALALKASWLPITCYYVHVLRHDTDHCGWVATNTTRHIDVK